MGVLGNPLHLRELFQTLPRRAPLSGRRKVFSLDHRADLIRDPIISKLNHQPLRIWMSVSSRHGRNEGFTKLDKQIHEIVIRISPIDVSKVEYPSDGIIFH